jgi:prepilin-type N-terminal cleavage/methylation domain-containing protein
MGFYRADSGFTLIELIVVIIIMSVLLVFAMPRFAGFIFTDDMDTVIRALVLKAGSLKNRAVRDQKFYVLNIDLDNNRFWITDESMVDEETLQGAVKQSYTLPGDVRIMDVEFPGKERTMNGIAEIFFYKKGYSDQAVIHIEGDDERKMSVLIEPFLPSIKLVEEYATSYH